MNERNTKLKTMRVFVHKMPSLSTAVSNILEICSRPDAAANDLNRVISLDPVLAGQVLKLINSAYYSLLNKVTSLTRAIIMLGLNTIKNLASPTTIIRSNVGQEKKSPVLPIKGLGAHSLGVGVMAKLLAAERKVLLAEREQGRTSWSSSLIEQARASSERARVKRLALFHHDPERSDDQLDRMPETYCGLNKTKAMHVFFACAGQEILH